VWLKTILCQVEVINEDATKKPRLKQLTDDWDKSKILSESLWRKFDGLLNGYDLNDISTCGCEHLGVKYNEEKEQKAKWDTKQKELANIEEAKKREAEKG